MIHTILLGHKIRAKTQFVAMEKYVQSIIDEHPKKHVVFIDHKKKVMPQKYREGQVEYFGKKGMCVLGAMLISHAERDSKWGFEYTFYDMIIKGYLDQDVLQVAAVLTKVLLPQLKKDKPLLEELIIISDNASCLASQDHIVPIHHWNRNKNNGFKVISWLFPEAQTDKNRLDTHFSFSSLQIRKYLEDGNDVSHED